MRVGDGKYWLVLMLSQAPGAMPRVQHSPAVLTVRWFLCVQSVEAELANFDAPDAPGEADAHEDGLDPPTAPPV
jgi:hypothetical protein